MYFHNIKAPPNRPGQPRNGSCMHTDDLNFKASSASDYLNRRWQLLEDTHQDDPDRPNFDEGLTTTWARTMCDTEVLWCTR